MYNRLLWPLLLTLAAAPTLVAADAAKTAAILREHCFRCHGANGERQGGFDDATDLQRLVDRGYVRPNDVAKSPLLQRVLAGGNAAQVAATLECCRGQAP